LLNNNLGKDNVYGVLKEMGESNIANDFSFQVIVSFYIYPYLCGHF